MPTDNLNDDLATILDIAASVQEDSKPRKDAAAALRYAVLKRCEHPDHLGLPVLVKYGDAQAVREEMGVSNNRVWGAEMRDDWVLFRVEAEDDLTPGDWMALQRQFLAIGAWYVGEASPIHSGNWVHHHFLWPEDHPVLQYMPDPP